MKTVIFAISVQLFSACLHAETELVMHEGVVIEARKDNVLIKVTAGKKFERTYEWDRCKLESDMVARQGRWYGSMGIYDPAFSFGFSFRGCSGISRTVVNEGQMHFDDVQFAQKWIEHYSRSFKTAWTNDGIFVAWGLSPGRRQLNVDVWMLCINGKRPKYLIGGRDSPVKIVPNAKGESLYECAQVGMDVINQTRSQFEADWEKYPISG